MEENEDNRDETFGGYDDDKDFLQGPEPGPDPEIDPGYTVPTRLDPVSPNYDPDDVRVVEIVDMVAKFCGVEFSEVPPDPDGEPNPDWDPTDPESPDKTGGVPVPLDDEEEPTTEPEEPGEKYPEGTGEDPNPELDKLRDEYKEALQKNLDERQNYWVKLWQVIRFISNITCWTNEIDDTFLMQTRTQTYSAEQVNACRPGCCHCDEDLVSIPLEYSPVANKPFIDGTITVFINGRPQTETITAGYLNSHFDPANNVVHIMREDFPDTLYYRNRCCCLCRRKATILLHYNAGYETIPVGLLPMICPLVKKIDESKDGLSDCANTMTQVAGLLKAKKVGNIQYEWSDKDSNTAKTQALYTDLYNLASVDEVYALSRCYIAEMPEEMGDVV